MTPAIQGRTYNKNTFFISMKRSCSSPPRVKEVVWAVVANFPGELRRLAAKSNLRLLEQQLQAH